MPDAETSGVRARASASDAERRAAAPARAHVVKQGETLTSIARRHGVSVQALRDANQLPERATLKVGQRLAIPATTPSGTPDPHGPRARATGREDRAEPSGRRSASAGTRAAVAPRDTAPRPPRDIVLAVPEFAETAPEFIWPLEGAVISPYGLRRSGWHRGVDIKAEPGTPIAAAADGTVVASGVEPRYGRVVKIEHADGFVTVYAHNEDNLVEVGAQVTAGTRIATVGRTGHATTEHLHFEIRRGAEVYNPLYLLPLPPRVAQIEERADVDEGHD